VSIFGAMNRREAKRRSLVCACLVVAAVVPPGVVAFQQSGDQKNGANAAGPKQGDAKVNPQDGLRYLWIPPGSLTTGCSSADKECYEDEYPSRKVTLTRGFWLSQTEVTQAAFRKIMDYNPSVLEGDDLPVDSVSWNEADTYCTAIGGRLPSAAEWEYAARAGTTGSRYGNLDDIAWYWGNSNWTTHPVGKKKPNAFGLYDMLGNVVEWTHTFYTVQLNQENINPTGPSTAEYIELRGGGWWDDADLVRASYRRRFEPTDEDYNIGFRCVSE
jgi:formylglycine-generating enzyme required for sulfatase activity